MTHLIQAVMEKVPEGATTEVRYRMFFNFCERMVKLNPGKMLPLGIKKSRWHFWETEHPFTTKYAEHLPK